MSRTEFNIGSDDSDDELNFQLNGLETPGTRKRRRARLIASAGTTPRDHQVTATGALESGGSGRGSARKRAPTPKQKALDEAAVAATTRPKKARGKQSHHEPAMPAVPEHAVVQDCMGPMPAPAAGTDSASSPPGRAGGCRTPLSAQSPASSYVADSTPGGEDPVPQANGQPQPPQQAPSKQAPWRLTDEEGVAFVNIVLDSCITQDVALFINTGASKYGNPAKWKLVAENVCRCAHGPLGEYYSSVDWEKLRRRVMNGKPDPKGFISYMDQAKKKDRSYDSGVGQEENEV